MMILTVALRRRYAAIPKTAKKVKPKAKPTGKGSGFKTETDGLVIND